MNRRLVLGTMAALLVSGSTQILADDAATDESVAIDSVVAEAQELASGVELDLRGPLPDILLGDPNAPVTIVEYASYSCSHCADFSKTVFPQLQEEYIETGKVNFVLREVIWDSIGMIGTLTARCLPEDKYYAMSEMLFQKQADWAFGKETQAEIKDELAKFTALAGVGREALDVCLADMENPEAEGAQERLEAVFNLSKERAEDAKITGTPTVFVNGESVTDWSWDNLSSVIEKEL